MIVIRLFRPGTLAFAFPFLVASGELLPNGRAETSAPSSHLVFDDAFPGDILIHQVRVPTGGEATYTYYETIGWRGKAAGYAGIQSHPKGRNFIFSIWDNKSHQEPIRAVHAGSGTKVEKFGGEGTGLKTWNFELGWEVNEWQTFVARAWPVEDHTYVGLWVQSGEVGPWHHIATMDVATDNAWFEGGNDAFIEDWLSTGENLRKMHLRNGWRRNLDGGWFATGKGRYSVNPRDLTEGKRSYQYRQSWNGGIEGDSEGQYYFMTAGGKETKPTVENPSHHSIPRKETKPELTPLVIEAIGRPTIGLGRFKVSWKVASNSLPQFSYEIRIFDNEKQKGEPLVEVAAINSEARSASIPFPENAEGKSLHAWLICRDLLDNEVSQKFHLDLKLGLIEENKETPGR